MHNLPTLTYLSFILDQDYGFEKIDGDVIISLGVITLDSNNWMEA